MLRAFAIALTLSASGVGASAVPPRPGPILLADAEARPRVSVEWTNPDGVTNHLDAELPWTNPDQRRVLGDNIEAFAALGGSRLEKGAGRPGGAIVRVGLVKTDSDLLLFDDIAHGSSITIEMRNIVLNQPSLPDPGTLLQRLRYRADDILACGLTINQTEMFNIVSADDTLGGAVLPEQVRHRCLGGGDPEGGRGEITVEDDGSITLRAVIPYRLLRHKGDPWALEVPGSFFEPFQFDLEFEVLPEEQAIAEGIDARRRAED